MLRHPAAPAAPACQPTSVGRPLQPSTPLSSSRAPTVTARVTAAPSARTAPHATAATSALHTRHSAAFHRLYDHPAAPLPQPSCTASTPIARHTSPPAKRRDGSHAGVALPYNPAHELRLMLADGVVPRTFPFTQPQAGNPLCRPPKGLHTIALRCSLHSTLRHPSSLTRRGSRRAIHNISRRRTGGCGCTGQCSCPTQLPPPPQPPPRLLLLPVLLLTGCRQRSPSRPGPPLLPLPPRRACGPARCPPPWACPRPAQSTSSAARCTAAPWQTS